MAKNRRIEKLLLYIVGPLLTVSLVVGLWYVLGFRHFGGKPTAVEAAAHYGDSFGDVNALFSGLALAGVIYAIVLQMIELRYQRLELKANRRELRKTADANAQLVRLNALTTLSQYYFEYERRHNAEIMNEYARALMYHPENIKQTMQYKMTNTARLLESLYGEVTGEPMGDAVFPDIPLERKKTWHANFYWSWHGLSNSWSVVEKPGFNYSEQQKDLVSRLKGYAEYLERTILRYSDCLDKDECVYREPLAKSMHEALRLAELIENQPQPVVEDLQAVQKMIADLTELANKSREFGIQNS